MRRLDPVRLLAVLLALPAVLAYREQPAYAQGACYPPAAAQSQNELPCRMYGNYGACTVGCGASGASNALSCPCFWDDPTNPNAFPVDQAYGSGNGTNCTPETPCCWNKPCFVFEDDASCALGGGGSALDEIIVEDNCHWFPEEGRCGCRPPLVDVLECVDTSVTYFAPFDCQCPYLTREEWLAQGGRGACAPPALDHFTLYKAKTSAAGARFVRFGPVVLSDAFQTDAPYEVTKPAKFGLPADKNGEGVNDADTHREEYFVKPVKGGPVFAPRAVHVVNQCHDVVVDVVKPVSLLVPTSKSLTGPVVAPDPVHHNLEHFLCYQAKAQAKLPKGTQVDVADQFQTRRYDLLAITRVCNAVDKAGTPALLAGPQKGTAKPILPAVRTTPDQHLVCYQMKPASKTIAQTGCGATTPGDKGTAIVLLAASDFVRLSGQRLCPPRDRSCHVAARTRWVVGAGAPAGAPRPCLRRRCARSSVCAVADPVASRRFAR